MKRLNCILIAVALMVGGTAVGQIQIPGGSIKPPPPPVQQRQKPRPKTRPKQEEPQQATKPTQKQKQKPQVKYYDVTFTCNAPDADLYIDGDYGGAADPCQPLKAGTHALKAITDS